MKISLRSLLLLGVLLGSCLLSACGKTGPLYLPDQATPQDAPTPAHQDK